MKKKIKTPLKMAGEDEKPLWQHLDDLRKCLIRSLVALLIGTALTFRHIESVIRFLEAPLLKYLPEDQQHLYFTGITDKFMTYFSVGLLIGFAVASPFILHQVWLFISPGLYRNEKRFAIPFVVFSVLSLFLGAAFSYYVVLPTGFEFLINFGGGEERPIITLGEYFSFTLKMMGAIALVFEVPVVLVVLGKLGIVSATFMRNYRRHAFIGISVLSAVVTPSPDALSMLLVMVPLYVLYEISIVGVGIVQPKP